MAAADAIDPQTRRFLRATGTSLPVLADPSAGARPKADPSLGGLRALAGHVRQHTLDHLDNYLAAAAAAVERCGGGVHWAGDAAEGRRIVAELVGDAAAVVVGSPVCDEVGWAAGRPGGAVVVVAAAFVVAETGQACLVGDADVVATAAAAPVLVCLAGVEAVVPRSVDLAVLLKLLSGAAAARPMANYTALVGGGDGRAFHLVVLDNGRTDVLGGEHRPLLRCIGCGACTAVCPVYRTAGIAPAGLWAGPIGAAVLPIARGGHDDLPHASTLCGACGEVCPVGIDLPAHLIAIRERSPQSRRRLRWWAWVMLSPSRYRWVTRWHRWRLRRRPTGWPVPPAASFQDHWRARS